MTSEEELLARAVALAADVAARVAADVLLSAGRPAPAEAAARRVGEYWVLRYDGLEAHLRDSRGLHHLARLLSAPGEPVHVLELVSGTAESAGREAGRGAGQPAVLDGQARSSYRRRLAELDAEVEAAHRDADLAREEQAVQERAFLVAELSRALGLGGRDRALGCPVERARVAVTKAVRTATRHVAEHHPALGAHLSVTVRTGTWCCYTGGVTWAVGAAPRGRPSASPLPAPRPPTPHLPTA